MLLAPGPCNTCILSALASLSDIVFLHSLLLEPPVPLTPEPVLRTLIPDEEFKSPDYSLLGVVSFFIAVIFHPATIPSSSLRSRFGARGASYQGKRLSGNLAGTIELQTPLQENLLDISALLVADDVVMLLFVVVGEVLTQNAHQTPSSYSLF